jgi:hypothetical protein
MEHANGKARELLAQVRACCEAVEELLEEGETVGRGDQEPLLLETALLKARHAMDDAVALVRTHRTQER